MNGGDGQERGGYLSSFVVCCWSNYAVPISAFLLTCATIGESDSGSDMEDYGGLKEDDDVEEV